MAVQVAATTVTEATASTTILGTIPASTVAGDLLLAHVSGNVQAAPDTPPPGWTLVRPQAGVTSSANNGSALFYRDAVAGDAGSTATFTGASSTADRMSVIVSRITGHNPTAPFDATAASSTGSNGATTYNAPSITTGNPGSLALYWLSKNTSTTGTDATTKTPTTTAGPTLVTFTDGLSGELGRLQAMYQEPIPAAGATGTRLFSSTSTVQWTGIVTAIRAADAGPPPAGTLVSMWTGDDDGDSVKINVDTSGAASVRLKVGTNATVTTGTSFTAPATPDSSGYASFLVSGLTPGTSYWYQAEIDGVLSTVTGSFTTDQPGTARSFRVAFGSCLTSGNATRTAFDNIVANNPELVLHLGDLHYDNNTTTSVAAHVASIANQIAANGGLREMLYKVPTAYVWSDHDSGDNDWSGGPATWTPSYVTAYAQAVPVQDPLPSGGIYRSIHRGRVKFILTDGRSFKSSASATDNASKTMFGAAQESWIAQELADPNYPVKVIALDVPWVYPTTAGDDKWGGYKAAGQRLVDAINAAKANVFLIHGDAHSLCADDGSSANNLGGLPVAGAAPFGNSTSIKGGPYSAGTWPTSANIGSTEQQHGLLDVTDTGQAITVRFSGRDKTNTERVTLSKTFTLLTEASGSLALTGSGSLALAGKPSVSRTLALSGSGSLGLAGKLSVSRALALSGSGALAMTGKPTSSGSLALPGVGSLTLFGSVSSTAAGGTLPLTGTGSLTLSGQAISPGSLALSGTGSLVLAALPKVTGSLALTGSGSLALAAVPKTTGSLGLTGSGSLVLSGAPNVHTVASGSLALSGTGQLRILGLSSQALFRAERPIFLGGPGADFVRAYNPNDVVPASAVDNYDLADDVTVITI